MDSHVEEGCSSETLAFMELAIEQAKDALNSLEVPVGCVIVEDGKVIASGRNRTTETRNATRHAEMEAIDVVLEQWQKSGLSVSEVAEKFSTCSLYVTCEPCIMCAAALSILGIKEVYYGCANDKFGGCGSILSLHCSSSKLPNSGDIAQRKDFKCTGGIMALEAVSLLRRFYEQGNPNDNISGKEEEQQYKILKPLISSHMSTHFCASAKRIGDGSGSDSRSSWKKCFHAESLVKMLICDNCEDSFHVYCCSPRVKRIPVDEWLCRSCLKNKEKIPKETIIRKPLNIIHDMGRCRNASSADRKPLNIIDDIGRSRNASSAGESNTVALMLRDTEPCTGGVRVVKRFSSRSSRLDCRGNSGCPVYEFEEGSQMSSVALEEVALLRSFNEQGNPNAPKLHIPRV